MSDHRAEALPVVLDAGDHPLTPAQAALLALRAEARERAEAIAEEFMRAAVTLSRNPEHPDPHGFLGPSALRVRDLITEGLLAPALRARVAELEAALRRIADYGHPADADIAGAALRDADGTP